MQLIMDSRLPAIFIGLTLSLSVWQARGSAIKNQESEAVAWIRAHSRSGGPDEDELAELKGANPDAYAIVKALLVKKSMGLIKTPDHHSAPLSDAPLGILHNPMEPPQEPPELFSGVRPPNVALKSPLNSSGNASQVLVNSGPPPPSEMPVLWTLPPTIAPEMPPPPPIPGPPPPAIAEMPLPAPLPSPAELKESMTVEVPKGFPEVPPVEEGKSEILERLRKVKGFKESLPHLSAASVATSSSSASQHNWLNWHPDQMIAENEKMVQNVLGAVAQLTGNHVSSHTPAHQQSPDDLTFSVPAEAPTERQEAALPAAMPAAPEAIPKVQTEDQVSETAPTLAQPALVEPQHASGESSPGQSKSNPDQMIAENEKLVQNVLGTVAQLTGRHVERHVPSVADDTEETSLAARAEPVSWNNPFTFAAASGNSKPVQPSEENQFLKGIDLGIPKAQLPPRRSSEEDNPYLQGLNLGSAAPSAGVDLKPSTLHAMHQSQLLTSHKLLESFSWGDEQAPQSPRPQRQARVPVQKPVAEPKSAGAVHSSGGNHVNAYLGVLGVDDVVEASDDDIAEVGSASTSTHSIPKLRGTKNQDDEKARFPLASFKWDDSATASSDHAGPSHQLSMTSNRVREKNSAHNDAGSQRKNSLGGWLKVATPAKVPDVRAERLQQSVQQKVEDDSNPYLHGLDLDTPQSAVQSGQNRPENGYLSNLG
jgi:hypothetical protein